MRVLEIKLSILLPVLFLSLTLFACGADKDSDAWLEYYNKGMALMDAGQMESAIKEFEKIPSLSSDSFALWTSYFWSGKANYELGIYGVATAYFTKAIDNYTEESNPVMHDLYLNRGRARIEWLNSITDGKSEGDREHLMNVLSDFNFALDKFESGEAHFARATFWLIAGTLDPDYFKDTEIKAALDMEEAQELSPWLFE